MKGFRWFVNGIKILLALGEEAISRTQIVVGFPISEVEWYQIMILRVQEPIQKEIKVLVHHYPMTWCGGIL